MNEKLERVGNKVARSQESTATVKAGKKVTLELSVLINYPLLWGPPPRQKPNLYEAVTRLYRQGKPVGSFKFQDETLSIL